MPSERISPSGRPRTVAGAGFRRFRPAPPEISLRSLADASGAGRAFASPERAPNPRFLPVHLEFERDIVEIKEQIDKLLDLAERKGLDVANEVETLRERLHELELETYRNLRPMEQVQVARHPDRPYTLDYIQRIFTDWIELHGDRSFRDDEAVVAGWGRLRGRSVMIIGQQKGRDMKENLRRNFGMPHPEGYRKALRLMRLAEKFGRPVVIFIDTPGAYPGIGAEERGIGQAIALNLREMSRIRVPTVSAVIGEGMSGGALGIGVTDRILMLEHAVYSVISPEGCAAILWRSAEHRDKAAAALRLTSEDLLELGVCDVVVPEPPGGAHSDWDAAASFLEEELDRTIAELSGLSEERLLAKRWAKYEGMGAWRES